MNLRLNELMNELMKELMTELMNERTLNVRFNNKKYIVY